MASHQVQLTSTPAGLHNKRAERYVQTFKQRRNSIVATLPYKLPEGKLEHELALATVRGMNSSCTMVSGKRTPAELFTGKKPHIPQHVFGQPGLCYNPNTAGPHGQWCLFLGQRGNEHRNNLRVFVPTTGTICSRLRFEPTNTYPVEWGYPPRLAPAPVTRSSTTASPPVVLPPPEPSRLWAPQANLPNPNLGVQTGEPLHVPPSASGLDELISPPPHQSVRQEGGSEVARQEVASPTRTSAEEQVTPPVPRPDLPQLPVSVARREIAQVVEPLPPPTTSSQQAPPPPPTPHSKRKQPQEGDKPTVTNAAPTGRVYATDRPRRQKSSNVDYSALHSGKAMQASIIEGEDTSHPFLKIYRVSLAQALREPLRIHDTLDAARKEITHLYQTLEALKPAHYHDIVKKGHQKHIINGHLFFKDKFHADGSYNGRKGRLVMNGNEESPDDMGDTRSPTIIPTSMLAALAVTANYPKAVLSAYDAVCAFPTTDLKPGKIIIVRIRGKLADLFTKTYPELSKFTSANGTIHFYLTKFMYGLAEAARAFYDRIDKVLTGLGFVRSEVDEGLYLKTISGHRQVHTVCVHVDDMLSMAPDENTKRLLEEGLSKHFEIKDQQGNEISYLGMLIKRYEDGSISVSQCGYIKDLLKKFAEDIKGKSSKTPANAELLAHEENPITYNDKSKYLSAVMSLMYLARLTRPDILMPISFLATK